MSIARETIDPKRWHAGYSPHPTLTARPLCFGDLLDSPQPVSGALRPADNQVQ